MEIVEGIELLATTEGIFTETAGGVTVAVLRKLARAGRWKGDETWLPISPATGSRHWTPSQDGAPTAPRSSPGVAMFASAWANWAWSSRRHSSRSMASGTLTTLYGMSVMS